jgi:hypothetical protein
MSRFSEPPTLISVVGLLAVALGCFGWGAWEASSLVRALGRPPTDVVVLRTSEGRRGHWTTVVAIDDRECTLAAFHAEPGEHVAVLVDPDDPDTCLPDAFFPSGYRPLSIFVFGGLAFFAGLSAARRRWRM